MTSGRHESKVELTACMQGLVTAANQEVTAANAALAATSHPSDRIIAMRRVNRAQARLAQATAHLDEANRS